MKTCRYLSVMFISLVFVTLLPAVSQGGPHKKASLFDTFLIEISPRQINPGDGFIVKVSGKEISSQPQAFFNGAALVSDWCGESCVNFLGAVDLNTKPGSYTIRLVVDGQSIEKQLVVKRFRFPTIRLTLPDEKVKLSPEDMRRVEREEEILNALWQVKSDKLWEGKFNSPLKNDLSTGFGVRRIINNSTTSLHKGVDIKGKEGNLVRASNRGRVVLAEELFFGGKTIILDHGLGVFSLYMHLSRFAVGMGEIVPGGTVIGFVGSTGRSSGPHLHFGIRVQEVSVNPVSFIKLPL